MTTSSEAWPYILSYYQVDAWHGEEGSKKLLPLLEGIFPNHNLYLSFGGHVCQLRNCKFCITFSMVQYSLDPKSPNLGCIRKPYRCRNWSSLTPRVPTHVLTHCSGLLPVHIFYLSTIIVHLESRLLGLIRRGLITLNDTKPSSMCRGFPNCFWKKQKSQDSASD